MLPVIVDDERPEMQQIIAPKWKINNDKVTEMASLRQIQHRPDDDFMIRKLAFSQACTTVPHFGHI
ncbi:hypothetical protein [Roseovarius ramblicola]|uniref:Uncharacterized protein n=1 Tax=Roseovarius ramblicola TaxID=2022336 RepID=A0ABV5I482_9RHOB